MASPNPPTGLIFNDPDLAKALHLDFTAADTQKWLHDNVSVHKVQRIPNDKVFPPPQFFWAENEKSKQDWTEAWKNCTLAEPRAQVKGQKILKDPDQVRRIGVTDRTPFRHVLARGQAGIFRDEDTGELVFARIPNIIQHPEILEAIDHVCKTIVRESRGDRRDDPGSLTNSGYTAGSRRNPKTGIGRAQLFKDMTAIQRARLNYENASMATLVWNIIKHRLPQEVVQDFDDAIERRKLRRMDAERPEGEYSLWSPDKKKEYRFSFDEAGPSRIACAMNYARFCHNEGGGNTYGVSFTTKATAKTKTGGNFFSAQYGILSMAEADTITVWRVRDFHGTSLYPREKRQTCGIAFFIPSSIGHSEPEPEEYTLDQIRAEPRPPIHRTMPRNPNKKTAERTNPWYIYDTTPEPESDNDEGNLVEIGAEAVHGDLDGMTPRDRFLMEFMAEAVDEDEGEEVDAGHADLAEHEDDETDQERKRSQADTVDSRADDSVGSRPGEFVNKRRKTEVEDHSVTGTDENQAVRTKPPVTRGATKGQKRD